MIFIINYLKAYNCLQKNKQTIKQLKRKNKTKQNQKKTTTDIDFR